MQPGRKPASAADAPLVHNILVLVISGDRGLAVLYTTNVIRYVTQFRKF
jgi:F0F1-type ATP synthase gamma subunit